jgi:hemerythrin superfamily protein
MATRKKRNGTARSSSANAKTNRSASKPARKRRSARGYAPDAISLLKSDHREVEALFTQFESASSSARKRAIVQKICDALTVHVTIEEEIFYPQARATLKKAGEDLLDEAEVEHEGIKWKIEQLKKGKPEDDLYDAEVTVLQEYVRHHVKEEERWLFPKLRLKGFDAQTVGEKLAARKEALTGKPVKEPPSLLERGIEALVGPSPGTI